MRAAVADYEVGDAALDESAAVFFDVAVVVADVVVADKRLPVFFFDEDDMAVVDGARAGVIETSDGKLAVQVIDAFEIGEEVGENPDDFRTAGHVGKKGAAEVGGYSRFKRE